VSVSNCCISQGSVATCLRCGGNYYTRFVGNVFLFTAVQEFWKSVKIWQSYRQSSGPQLFWDTAVYRRTHYRLHFPVFSLPTCRVSLASGVGERPGGTRPLSVFTSDFVHSLSTVCSLSVLFTLCTFYVHSISTPCRLYAHSTFFVHFLFTPQPPYCLLILSPQDTG